MGAPGIVRSHWVILGLLAAVACSGGDPISPPFTTAEQPGRIAVDLGASVGGLPRDGYQIEEAHIDRDTLRLRVTHGGGCAVHEYGLTAYDGWLESNPVQVRALLLHDAHGDMCDALLTVNLRFDLQPLKQAYLRAYGGSSGTVVIRLSDPRSLGAEPLARLTYTF